MAESLVEARTSRLPVAAGPGPGALPPAVVPLSLGLPLAGGGDRSVGAMPVFELVVTPVTRTVLELSGLASRLSIEG